MFDKLVDSRRLRLKQRWLNKQIKLKYEFFNFVSRKNKFQNGVLSFIDI